MSEYRVVRDILGNPNWEEHIFSTNNYSKAKFFAKLLMVRDIETYENQAIWTYMIIDNYTEEILCEVFKK